MPDFEYALTHALNEFFEKDGIAAIAYRLKQSRFSTQFMDILVDSKIPEYYLAIECKSLDARKTRSLYFKQHFSLAAGGHQMARETEFITRSGRQGILAVELRHGNLGRRQDAGPRLAQGLWRSSCARELPHPGPNRPALLGRLLPRG